MGMKEFGPGREAHADQGAAIYFQMIDLGCGTSEALDKAVARSDATRDEIRFHIYGEGFETEWNF